MHADPTFGVYAAPDLSAPGGGGRAPFEWSVCPGAAEAACMSEMPHGTIITATAFTSLSLLHCELAGEEKVQYEVHLLTGGLLQCGWCVSPAGLPFTTQEGVGDFPMSLAADGLRGLVWNLTPVDVPALRWVSGDILSCYADLATGRFDFALNGQHCHTATLPTKTLLLRHGARWYNDKHSTDEMLQYTPAMSLEGGEACVVNLGEAPMRYPRPGYRTLCETFWYAAEERSSGHSTGSATHASASAAAAAGVIPSSGPGTRSTSGANGNGSGTNSVYVGATTATTTATNTTSGSSSSNSSSFGAPYSQPAALLSTPGACGGHGACLTLGGIEVASLLKSVGLQVPMGVPLEGTYMYYKLLDSWVEEPARVVERCARLVSWLQADAQTRWKAFTVWLYLWITRFYVQLRETGEWDGTSRVEDFMLMPDCTTTTPAETLAHVRDVWHALELFMPPASFALVPGMIMALLQHRLSDRDITQRFLMRIAADLASLRSFRAAWVADTVSFTSTLLNVFALCPLRGAHRETFLQLLQTHTPDECIVNPSLFTDVFAHQTERWSFAAQIIDAVAQDTSNAHRSRAALSVALLRYLQDRKLKSALSLAHRGTESAAERFLEAYPYTFASAYSPTVLASLTLAVAAALGKQMWLLSSEGEDSHLEDVRAAAAAEAAASTAAASTAATEKASHTAGRHSDVVLQVELGWRAVAMQYLPPARFFARPLSAPTDGFQENKGSPACKDFLADRLGGSVKNVSAGIEAEVSQLMAKFANHAVAAAAAVGCPIADAAACDAGEKATTPHHASDRSNEPASPPPTHRNILESETAHEHPNSTNNDAQQSNNNTNHHDNSSNRFSFPSTASATTPATTMPDPLLSTLDEHWRAVADAHLARRGHFTCLPTNPAGLTASSTAAAALTLTDFKTKLEDALAERAEELFLVTVIALDTYVRGLFARCAALPSTLYQAITALQTAPAADVAPQGSNSGNVAGSQQSNVTTADAFAQVRHVSELLRMTYPLRDDGNSAALTRFCAVVGRVYGYYWARMAIFERCYCMSEAHEAYRAAEVAEAPLAPPRAFLMLPAQLSNVFVDLWLLLGLVRGHNAALAAQEPLLFRFFFDANMRRATSNVFAREYLYQAVASVLGAGEGDRLHIAEQLQRMQRANPSESAGKLSFLARHFADFLGMAQRSPNERAPVNVVAALLQAEANTLVPPPRMLDEKFGWLLLLLPRGSSATAEAVAHAVSASDTQEQERSDEESRKASSSSSSADAIFLRIFAECTSHYTAGALLFPFIYQCNALLSRFSEVLPPSPQPPRWSEATKEAIASFYALYQVLRKTLCAMNVVCRTLHHREGQLRRAATDASPLFQLKGGAAAVTATTPAVAAAAASLCAVGSPPVVVPPLRSPAASSLNSSLSDLHTSAAEKKAEEMRQREECEALRGELMDVLVQCLVRVLRPLMPHSHSTQTHTTDVPPTIGRRGGQNDTKISDSDGNQLQPAVVCDVKGGCHWRASGCSRAGLLAPIFSMLLLFLEVGGTTAATNAFLAAAGAELPTLVRLSLSALAHTTWWSGEALQPAEEQRKAEEQPSAPALSARLQQLQTLLQEVEATCAMPSYPPAEGEGDDSQNASRHSAHTRAEDRSRTPPSSRSTSATSAHTAEETREFSAAAAAAAPFTPHAKGEVGSKEASSGEGSHLDGHPHAIHSHSGGDECVDDDAVAGDDGAEPANTCLICLSRRIDVRMLPCRHECCRCCYRRYQRVEHARLVATEASSHTWSSSRNTPSPSIVTSVSHTYSEASAAHSVPSPQTSLASYGRPPGMEDESAPGVVLTGDSITYSMVEQEIAAAEFTAVRCFFCKETVESVQRIPRPEV